MDEEATLLHKPLTDEGPDKEKDSQVQDTETGSFQTRFIFTLFLYVVYLVHGTSTHVLGPSLLDLKYLTNSSTSSVAAAFTWRYGFTLMGTLLSGPIINRVNACLIMAMALLAMGLTTALVPVWSNLLGLYITNGFVGVVTAINDVCGTATIIQVWGEEAKPYQQALHLTITLGAALTPEIMKPFMGQTPVTSSMVKLSLNRFLNASMAYPVENMTYLQRNITNEVIQNSSASQQITGTHILYSYLIIAACLVTLSIASFVIVLFQGCKVWRNTNDNTAIDDKDTLITGKPKIVMLLLFFLQSVMYGGYEEVVGGFLLTYVVVFLGWSSDHGSDITGLFWVCITLSRVTGIVLAKYIRSARLFPVQLGVILVSIVTLICARSSHWMVTLICFATIGLGGGSLYPTLINWGHECLHLQGIETSVFFAGLALAKMAFPPLVGYLLKSVGAESFLYLILAQIVFFILCYITTVVLLHCLERIRQRDMVNEKSPLVSSGIN